MIKTGDKIGFRRTEYGALEFGTYRGYADGKYSVELEGGDIVEMTTESYSGSKWATKSPMKYFRLAYKNNATSTTHVEDVRAVSAEEAAAISPMKGLGYPLTQVKEISLAERVEAIKSHIGMADFDRKMMVRCGVMSEERAQQNYENVVRHYEVELKEVEEDMVV